MEPKKSPNKDMDKKRFQLFEIGFILTLAFVFLAFQYQSSDINDNTLGTIIGVNFDDEIIPITRIEVKKPEPPKPKIKIITNITEVPDDTKKTYNDYDEYWKLFNSNIDIDSILVYFSPDDPIVNDTIYLPSLLQTQPSFNGNLDSYIINEVKFPKRPLENGVDGTVYVEFVIEIDGSISNVSIARGVCSDLDKEAMRVIENMPKWNPGKQMGKPVRVRYWKPIKFSISD